MDEERAAEIGFALNVDASAGFNVLGEEFGEDDLLGKKFRANGDVRLRGLAAGGKEVREVKEAEEVKETEEERAAHVSASFSWSRGKAKLCGRSS